MAVQIFSKTFLNSTAESGAPTHPVMDGRGNRRRRVILLSAHPWLATPCNGASLPTKCSTHSPALWMATTAAMSSSEGVHPLRFMALKNICSLGYTHTCNGAVVWRCEGAG